MIRKLTVAATLLIVVLTTVVGCHRQKLEEILYTKALIPVLIDWETRALMDIDNDPDGDLYSASVWLFPTEESLYQGDPIECKISNAIYDYIEVPVGVFDVLVFNKTVGEYSNNVGFRGTDSFDSFEYYTNPYISSSSTTSKIDGLEVRLEPDLLAAWRSAEESPLVVTRDMVDKIFVVIECRSSLETKYFTNRSNSATIASKAITLSDFDELSDEMKQLLDLKPERLTHIVTVEECVENLHSASAATGAMLGMSSSVTLAGAEYSTTQTSQTFQFDNKYITSEDGRDGYMDAEFRVIGPLKQSLEPQYTLKTVFTLYNTYEESLIYPTPPASPYVFDVTTQIYEGEAEMGLDKVLPINICPLGNIVLPDIAVGGEGGFNAEVNDWDDEIDIPL
ncbi:MAG: DUF5119 domain-containing protein [Rikenellaceae bacterium]